MDQLEIEGKQYISSKRASELTGYTKDYIGQLARGEKVIATRVGRAWYIQEEDIRKHAGLPIDTASSATQPLQKAQDQAPVSASNNTIYSIHSYKGPEATRNTFKTWGEVSYEADERDLFPQIQIAESSEQEDRKDEITSSNIAKSVKTNKNLRRTNEPKSFEGVVEIKSKKIATNRREGRRSLEKQPSQNLVLITATASLVLMMTLLAGLSISESGVFAAESSQGASSATSFGDSFLAIFDYFRTIFEQGVALLGGFLSILFDSFELFINIALDFLGNLF